MKHHKAIRSTNDMTRSSAKCRHHKKLDI